MRAAKKTRSRIFNTLSGLLVLFGVLVLLYAPVSKYLQRRHQMAIAYSYGEYVSGLNQEVLIAEREKAREYNDILAGRKSTGAVLTGSGKTLPENYQQVLNVGGIMGVIRIPKIRLQLPVYHGTSDLVLRKGIGHISKTSLPIGGAGNHVVLTGHRALTTAELFTNLDKLIVGDIFYLDVLEQTLAYQVDQILVTEPEDLAFLNQVPGEDYVTLVTCTPYAVNTHRLLVRGTRISEEEAEKIPAEVIQTRYSWKMGASISVAAFFFLWMFFLWTNTKGNEEIKIVQRTLNKSGYSCGRADGILGEKTIVALMKFQKDAGLFSDGSITDKTKEKLNIKK